MDPLHGPQADLAEFVQRDPGLFGEIAQRLALAPGEILFVDDIQNNIERARAAGGNAVVGVDLDYEVINNMLMVSASPIRFSIAFWCLLTHFLPLSKSGSPGSASRTHSADSAKLGGGSSARGCSPRCSPLPA